MYTQNMERASGTYIVPAVESNVPRQQAYRMYVVSVTSQWRKMHFKIWIDISIFRIHRSLCRGKIWYTEMGK